MADISKVKINDTTYNIKDAVAQSDAADALTAANGKVSKTGDTMSGNLEMANSNNTAAVIVHRPDIDTAVTPAATNWSKPGFAIADADGDDKRAYIRIPDLDNGVQGVQIETSRVVNGTRLYNGVYFGITSDGKYTFVANNTFINTTSALTSGTSALGNGCYHFQYE